MPITGMPPLESALVWSRGRADRRRDEFVDIARRILAGHREERPLTG